MAWDVVLGSPFVSCLVYSFIFIIGLYFGKGGLSRNHPTAIRSRFISVAFTCTIIMLHILTFIHKSGHSWRDPFSYNWHQIFIRSDHLSHSFIVPLSLTMVCFSLLVKPIAQVLYLGTLVDDLVSGRMRLLFDLEFLECRFFNWISVRNLLVAPTAEEFVFRACILFHLQPLYSSCERLCLISPLFFSIAHFHHIYGQIREGERAVDAFLKTLFQVAYTTLFGAYSAFLLLRTGNLMAAIVAHSVCNFMSLPDPVGAMKRAQLRLGLFGQLLSVAAHLAGLLLWLNFLYPATDPRKFSNHITTCYW
ncbi:hypothetical protein P879_03668 [Paragonimus westermani]|uniref:CAAX prenyl protease 2 n=1 Tax=Paragonimus westermani TaxID=34504 RepID=A0A8T0DW27_9TREM|nr:hypothetical protein P879_03668 [Paragonimus westermani]